MKIVITGRPGSGKSTVLRKVIERLRSKGFVVGGMICPDQRDERGFRIGFRIIDVLSGASGWLARKDYRTGPRIGRYRVNVVDAERIGVEALRRALERADVVVIDEVGPMELLVPSLKEAMIKALLSNKSVVAVVHYRLRDPRILDILKAHGYRWFTVTLDNRDKLPDLIAGLILDERAQQAGPRRD